DWKARRGRWPPPGGGLLVSLLVVAVLGVCVGLGLVALPRLVHHRHKLRGVLLHILLAVLAAQTHEPSRDHEVDGLVHVPTKFVLAHRAGLERVVLALLLNSGFVERS